MRIAGQHHAGDTVLAAHYRIDARKVQTYSGIVFGHIILGIGIALSVLVSLIFQNLDLIFIVAEVRGHPVVKIQRLIDGILLLSAFKYRVGNIDPVLGVVIAEGRREGIVPACCQSLFGGNALPFQEVSKVLVSFGLAAEIFIVEMPFTVAEEEFAVLRIV